MRIRTQLLGAVGLLAVLGAAAPAVAQYRDRDWGRHDGWRGHESREHEWRERREEFYRPPPVYYAPRPFYYAPPLAYSAPPTVFYGRPGYGY